MKGIKRLFGAAPVRAEYADAGDFLRVAAVGLVGWFHIWQQSWLNPDVQIGGVSLRLYPLVSCGYLCVDLMLLLSGFLLMLGWLSGRNRDLRSFYAARIARICPSYLLCVGVMLFAVALPGGQYASARHLWTDLLAHLSFTHNLFFESYLGTRLNGALWTLAVEAQFYLLFPFIARRFEKDPARTYVIMVLLGFCSRMAVMLAMQDTSLYFNRLSAMLDVYANGMMAAWIYKRLAGCEACAWRAWLSTALMIAALPLLYKLFALQRGRSGAEMIRMGQMLYRYPLTLLGGVVLVCGSRAVGLVRALLSNRITRFLSGVSFNFYIWHQFLAVKLKEWRIPYYEGETPNQRGLQPWQTQYTIICFAGALLLAIAITYLVEKPCARWIKKRLTRRKGLETKRPAC